MMRDTARATIREILRRKPVDPYEPFERRLWLLRPDHLGDLLFLKPGLARLRERLPDWHITLAVGPWSRSVVDDDPHVDEIVELRYPGFDRDKSGGPVDPYRMLFAEAQRIRVERPAAVVVLRDDHWWGALLARLSGTPVIIGARQPEMRGLLTDPVTLTGCHAVERNAEMLNFAATRLGAALSCQPVTWETAPLRWNVNPDDQEFAASLLRSIEIAGDYVVIHPGSGAPAKLWPADRWAWIADEVSRRGFEVVLTGGELERALVDRIASEAGCRFHPLVGKTSLKALAAVFRGARVVAGVDSGPLHLAVAVRTPTLHLFGPSEPERFGPWGDPARHRVVSAGMRCKSCGDLRLSRPEGAGCMLAIREPQVANVLHELLRR